LLASAEDYQLLFTAPPSATTQLLDTSPVPLTRLGQTTDAPAGHRFHGEDGHVYPMQSIGFVHF
jgi:thiamine monophosphate kinase